MTINLEFPIGKQSHIAIARNALDADVCERVMRVSRNLWDEMFNPGRTMAGYDPSMKETMDWTLTDFSSYMPSKEIISESIELDKIIFDSLGAVIKQYITEYPGMDSWVKGMRDTSYLVQVYKQGQGFYKTHVDAAPWLGYPQSLRVLACVMYLNTVDEGGETEFTEHGLKISPEQGDMLMFPAYWTHPHAARVPLSGDKWIISTFVTHDPDAR